MTFPESSGEEWKESEYAGFDLDEHRTLFHAFYWANALYAECSCCTALMAEFSERFHEKSLTGRRE